MKFDEGDFERIFWTIIGIAIIIAIFNGCSHFQYYDRAKECEELLDRSKIQLEQAQHLIDSLYTRTMELENAQP